MLVGSVGYTQVEEHSPLSLYHFRGFLSLDVVRPQLNAIFGSTNLSCRNRIPHMRKKIK